MANLSFAALTGVRKQSIRDAENLFSASVQDFMRRKEYTEEEQLIRTVNNWRRACDERGLTIDVRVKYHQDLVNYFLKEVSPWYGTTQNLSCMEVTRYVYKFAVCLWIYYYVAVLCCFLGH